MIWALLKKVRELSIDKRGEVGEGFIKELFLKAGHKAETRVFLMKNLNAYQKKWSGQT